MDKNIMFTTFQNKFLPDNSNLIGFSWLIKYLGLTIPLKNPSSISNKRLTSQRINKGDWILFDAQFKIEESAYSHLEFAIKHENLDLLVLKYILKSFSKEELIKNIQTNPKRTINKKIWFYYEFLLDEKLPLDDLPTGRYTNLLDAKKYFTKNNPIKSKRHKINNNLLGTNRFCPIIQKTQKLQHYISSNFSIEINSIINQASKSLLRRASSFLLLADSKASFEIEGERVTKNRIENWGKIINQAGEIPLSLKEIQRLHATLIGDTRFIKIGLRDDEVFLGDRDRENYPLPEFIGAKSKDLETLMEDWLALHKELTQNSIDPVLHAVIIAFSFVYIHPLQDGNGRIHRYLLHHILAKRGFYPKGVIFPLSSVILEEIERYKEILVEHTKPLMSMIKWEATSTGNVRVVNDTSDLYRFFDITKSCEFIYETIEKTIKETLPNEIKYIKTFDIACYEINEIVAMPDNMVNYHHLKRWWLPN